MVEEEKQRRVDAEARLAALTQEKAAWEAAMVQKGEEIAAANQKAEALKTSQTTLETDLKVGEREGCEE